jgi:hypothetical protein
MFGRAQALLKGRQLVNHTQSRMLFYTVIDHRVRFGVGARDSDRDSRQPATGFVKGREIVGGIRTVVEIDVRGDRLDR